MAKEFKLSMVLSARDAASKVITKLMRDSTKESQNAEKAQEKLGKRQRTTAEEGIRQNRALGEEVRRQNRARETLGVRAERAIQREIQQTVAAYNRLARSGTLSIDEQSRAYSRMRQRVGELKTEMQGMNKLARLSDIGGSLTQIGGAMIAGGMAYAEPVKKQMSYEQRLAYMSNTAFSDRDAAGRQEGMKNLDALIRKSVAEGGGSIDEAAEVLSKLLSEGIFTDKEINGLLPLIQKYSTASGVQSLDLAAVSAALKKNFGISDPKDIKTALDMALKGGQEGAFELPDMAKWLAQQLSAANSVGMNGLDDFASIVAANQAVVSTAGTNDQAGNNLMNFLLKLNSRELGTAAERIKVDGYGIDLSGTLINAREKGIDPIDAFIGLTDKIAANNPKYKALQDKLNKTDQNDPEHQRTLAAMAKIAEGSAIGQLIGDQGTLMAVIGLKGQSEYRNEVKQKVLEQKNKGEGQGEGDIQFAVISAGNQFKTDQAGNAKQFAEMDSAKPVSDALGTLADKFTDFSKEFPTLTTAAMGAKTAIEAMTQAAVAFAALKFLFGGGSGLGGVLGGKGTPKPGMFNPIGGAGTGGLPVHVTNWRESGFNSQDKSLLAKFGTYATAIIDIENSDIVKENLKSLQDKHAKQFADEGLEGSKYPYLPAGIDIWLQKRDQRLEDNPIKVSPYLTGESASPFIKNERAIDKDVITFDTLEKSGVLQPLLDLTQALKNPPPPPVIEVRSVVELDGQQVAESVNRVNGQDAGRTTGGMFP
ncbi:phage tail tape measure protein [Providencia huaxiensis]|uniref:phage tail tape measure protein n=1 Tax=Providencia huaxiensis TaxID=2027290 RepID=UPI000C7E902B|nr:phage tail tape measure protein [Providencia huaxiensis]AXH61270.1 phage tail tape measure protein [Providencia huaxiensis]